MTGWLRAWIAEGLAAAHAHPHEGIVFRIIIGPAYRAELVFALSSAELVEQGVRASIDAVVRAAHDSARGQDVQLVDWTGDFRSFSGEAARSLFATASKGDGSGRSDAIGEAAALSVVPLDWDQVPSRAHDLVEMVSGEALLGRIRDLRCWLAAPLPNDKVLVEKINVLKGAARAVADHLEARLEKK